MTPGKAGRFSSVFPLPCLESAGEPVPRGVRCVESTIICAKHFT